MLINSAKPVEIDKGKLELIIVFQSLFTIGLVLFRVVYQPLVFRQESLVYTFCCVFFITSIWSLWSWYFLTKSLFNPYCLFLLSALLFNGGEALLEVFHLNENGIGNWHIKSDLPPISSELLVDTLFLVIIGLIVFHLGALIALATLKRKSDKSNLNDSLFIINSKKNRVVGWRLIYISFIPALIMIKDTIAIVMASGYSALYQVELATSYSAAPTLIADFLIPGSLFLLVGSKENKKNQLASVSIILIYSMARFFLGQRNQAVMPLVACAWLWHKSIKPIPKVFLLAVGSLMLLIFPLIAGMRNSFGQDRLSIKFLQETFSSVNNPILSSINEMGGSMLTVAYTLEWVPSAREFQLGADYFYALLTLVPNFFGRIHPTIARGLPEHWLTEQINPHFAEVGGSYGYSFIAEAYLNFGWIGAPIALGIIGFLFTKLTLWGITSSQDPAKIAMLASFLSVFLFYARAESALIVRGLVWYSLIPYIWVHLIKKSYSSKDKKR